MSPEPKVDREDFKVSVVVPIYNTEMYLDQCLQSISEQTLSDIEVICVDDGSTDSSANIAESYCNADARFTLIKHGQNLGLGPTRNTGIETSKGTFVANVDSDDFIANEMIESLYNLAIRNSSDIVVCAIEEVSDDGAFSKIWPVRSVDTLGMKLFQVLRAIFNSSCNKIWRKSFLIDNNIRFESLAFSEDFVMTVTALAKRPNVSVINEPCYKYRVGRRDAMSGTLKETQLFDHIRAFGKIRDILVTSNIFDDTKNDFFRYAVDTISFHTERLNEEKGNLEQIKDYMVILLMLKCGFLAYGEAIYNSSSREIYEYLAYGAPPIDSIHL